MKQLIKKYRSNSLTPEEIVYMREHLDAFTDEEIIDAIGDDWRDFEPDSSLCDGDAETRVKERLSRIVTPGKRGGIQGFLKYVGRVAAVAVIALLGYSSYHFYEKSRLMGAQQFMVSTGEYERANVMLPDGSMVELNNASEVSYTVDDFGGATRKIAFNGEAFFEIVPMPDRPFVIKAGEVEVVVKGTTFNLMAREDGEKAVLSLIEGKVELTALKSDTTIDLSPDEKAVVDLTNGEIEVSPIEDNDNVLAWHLGRLTFVNAGYDEVMNQLRVHYGDAIPVEISGGAHSERFTGMIPLDNVSVALDIISTTFK